MTQRRRQLSQLLLLRLLLLLLLLKRKRARSWVHHRLFPHRRRLSRVSPRPSVRLLSSILSPTMTTIFSICEGLKKRPKHKKEKEKKSTNKQTLNKFANVRSFTSTMSSPALQHIKLVVIGNGAVGKTCSLITYTTGSFPGGDPSLTIEYIPMVFDNYSAHVTIGDQVVSLDLWDTGGRSDEYYDRLLPLSFPLTDIFLIMFDVMNATSFLSVEERWYPLMRKHCPTTSFILFGNKIGTV